MKINKNTYGILMFILAGITISPIIATYVLWANWGDMLAACISPVAYYTYNFDEWYVRHITFGIVIVLSGTAYIKGSDFLMRVTKF